MCEDAGRSTTALGIVLWLVLLDLTAYQVQGAPGGYWQLSDAAHLWGRGPKVRLSREDMHAMLHMAMGIRHGYSSAQPGGSKALPPPPPLPPLPPPTPAPSYLPTPIPHTFCATGRLMPNTSMKLGGSLLLSVLVVCLGCAHGAARCAAVPLGGTAVPPGGTAAPPPAGCPIHRGLAPHCMHWLLPACLPTPICAGG
jgi:hypothetical protein